ncbi:MAG: hypothetical protein ACJAS3_001061 [Roseivirga sp.]|jgi:hypothetical protein
MLIVGTPPIDSIPFKLEKDNSIYTYLKVNQPNSLCFLIQTGASEMVIHIKLLAMVNMSLGSIKSNRKITGVIQLKWSKGNSILWGAQA